MVNPKIELGRQKKNGEPIRMIELGRQKKNGEPRDIAGKTEEEW